MTKKEFLTNLKEEMQNNQDTGAAILNVLSKINPNDTQKFADTMKKAADVKKNMADMHLDENAPVDDNFYIEKLRDLGTKLNQPFFVNKVVDSEKISDPTERNLFLRNGYLTMMDYIQRLRDSRELPSGINENVENNLVNPEIISIIAESEPARIKKSDLIEILKNKLNENKSNTGARNSNDSTTNSGT